jgi:hypothetical protein
MALEVSGRSGCALPKKPNGGRFVLNTPSLWGTSFEKVCRDEVVMWKTGFAYLAAWWKTVERALDHLWGKYKLTRFGRLSIKLAPILAIVGLLLLMFSDEPDERGSRHGPNFWLAIQFLIVFSGYNVSNFFSRIDERREARAKQFQTTLGDAILSRKVVTFSYNFVEWVVEPWVLSIEKPSRLQIWSLNNPGALCDIYNSPLDNPFFKFSNRVMIGWVLNGINEGNWKIFRIKRMKKLKCLPDKAFIRVGMEDFSKQFPNDKAKFFHYVSFADQ